jgi:hypothetical protein
VNDIVLGDATAGTVTANGTITVVAGGSITTGRPVAAAGTGSDVIVQGTSIVAFNSVTAGGNVSLTATTGAISGDATVTGDLLTVRAFSGAALVTIINTLDAVVTAGPLTISDAGAITLGGLAPISVSSGSISVTASGAVTVARSVSASGVNPAANVTIQGTSIAVNADISATGTVTLIAIPGPITGSGRVLSGVFTINATGDLVVSTAFVVTRLNILGDGGTIVVDNPSNDVDQLFVSNTAAGIAAGSVTFRDADGFDIVGSTAANLVLIANGDITQSGPITGSNLAITNTAGVVALTQPTNNVGSVAIANGNRAVSYRDADAVAVAAAGIQGGAVALTAGGDLTQVGLITASSLDVVNSGGSVSLGSLANPVGTAAIANAGRAAAFRAAGALGIGAAGIQAGSLVLTTGGNVTQGGAVTTGTFQLNATGAGAVDLRAAGNAFSVLDANIGPAVLSLANAAPLTIDATETLNVGSVIVSNNVRVNTPGNLVISPVANGLLQSSTQLDLRGVQGDIQLLNGGRLAAPQILVNDSVPIQVGGNVTTPADLNIAVDQVNTLPPITGTIYEIVVAASMTVTRTLSFTRPVLLTTNTPGVTLSGSSAVTTGVTVNVGASGSRITNLAFAGFSDTAVRLSSATGVAISGISVSGSGNGLWISGTSTYTTVQGSRFTDNNVAIRLGENRTIGATGVVIGGTAAAQRNTIAGARRAGVVATGFCTGSRIIGTTFTASPRTRVPFDVRSSRGLRISGTSVQRAPTPQVPVRSVRPGP